ncbi:MAG: hypothetical protein CGU28_04825 [Candidatus Dactylopiibacterium carminicum]|uniref:Uncharacterized protein n=1 Tax=Candidatus Dactylopiibacterium carminicum TaxID=857335 RepID=A0A272EU92_9RHOO|nr:hypothetical protein BGI27_06455 [Candidatus Dactylopiibacterium carminicum]PAS93657.1 MAG: hypothetical protein CGU29_06895 [Candidatus Dactylopiibacterium carminicum]PAS97525.1 MAG: hypothetical protein CGU28_04825 [Candidatus Dactylopiibacterium carminicum]PAS99723.1 MAG: hypothetical protein BSR46_06490 [Candidatus Dactylopiibacterium carminicum]
MYIVVIAWLFVALLVALDQASIIAMLLSFMFGGVLPLALLWWILGTPARSRARQARESRNKD